MFFFFSQEKFEPYTHTQFQRAEKKTGQEKKNTIFTNTHDFFKKVVIFKLFLGKKYGTYIQGSVFDTFKLSLWER